MESKVRSQVTVTPQEFLYHHQDSIHHVQLRCSLKMTSEDIDYQGFWESGLWPISSTAESGFIRQQIYRIS